MYYISDYTESIPILLSEWNHNFWTDDKPSPELSKLKIGTDGTFIWLITTICMWFFFFLDRFYNSTVFVYSLKKMSRFTKYARELSYIYILSIPFNIKCAKNEQFGLGTFLARK